MSFDTLNYHRSMVTDAVRMAAWRQAVTAAVRPGDVVADVGAGTGVLSLAACAAGARRVYAMEPASILEVAREVTREAGLSDRIVFLSSPSFDLSLPEPARVIVADLFGSFGLDGSALPVLIDARTRFLAPGGQLLPAAIELHCAPIEAADWRRRHIDCWSEGVAGFPLHAARRRALAGLYRIAVTPEAALAAPVSLGVIDLQSVADPVWSGHAAFVICRPGTLDAVAGWCTGHLTSTIAITNSPFAAVRVTWPQAVFGLDPPVRVEPGDAVEVSFHCAPLWSFAVWNWQVRVRRDGAELLSFRASTLPGEMLPLEEIRKQSPDYLAVRSRRGEAVQAVLGLCDGSRSAAEVRREIQRLFPDLAPGESQAARLVSTVILSLCR